MAVIEAESGVVAMTESDGEDERTMRSAEAMTA